MGAPEWEPYIQYYADDIVRYQDRKYKVRQAHTSQHGRTPEVTPELWEQMSDIRQQSAPRFETFDAWIDASRKRTEDFNYNGPQGPTTWVLAEQYHVPRSAIVAGEKSDGTQLYVARSYHGGGLHIGCASSRGAFLPYGGEELPVPYYEILLGDADSVLWVANSESPNGVRPVEGGYENSGQPILIAQALVEKNILPGKAWDFTNGARVAYNGVEISVSEYNILAYV